MFMMMMKKKKMMTMTTTKTVMIVMMMTTPMKMMVLTKMMLEMHIGSRWKERSRFQGKRRLATCPRGLPARWSKPEEQRTFRSLSLK
jgi:hypothetical protein